MAERTVGASDELRACWGRQRANGRARFARIAHGGLPGEPRREPTPFTPEWSAYWKESVSLRREAEAMAQEEQAIRQRLGMPSWPR